MVLTHCRREYPSNRIVTAVIKAKNGSCLEYLVSNNYPAIIRNGSHRSSRRSFFRYDIVFLLKTLSPFSKSYLESMKPMHGMQWCVRAMVCNVSLKLIKSYKSHETTLYFYSAFPANKVFYPIEIRWVPSIYSECNKYNTVCILSSHIY